MSITHATVAVGTDAGTGEIHKDQWNAAHTGSNLTVEESDGNPTDSAVTKIIFPNGTLTIVAHEATFTPTGGPGGASDDFIFFMGG